MTGYWEESRKAREEFMYNQSFKNSVISKKNPNDSDFHESREYRRSKTTMDERPYDQSSTINPNELDDYRDRRLRDSAIKVM